MDRRTFVTGTFGMAALTSTAAAAVDPEGSVAGASLGRDPDSLHPGASYDQGAALQALLEERSRENRPLFLPPGDFVVSNVRLPSRTRLVAVAGATRLIHGEGAALFTSESAEYVELSGLVIDGIGGPLAEYVPGLVHLTDCPNVTIDNCEIVGSSASGIALGRSGGRISNVRVSGAAVAAIRAIESTGLSIKDNVIEDCDNGGILVWRWNEGEDGTIVSGNRITRIAARDGGTGEKGNGINVFRAHDVVVTNNHITDCASSAVRANSANDVRILGNHCGGSGDVAIHCAFSFAGAVVANNVVNGAGSGISIANFREGGRMAVVANNVVRNLFGNSPDGPAACVGISVEADATLSGNVVEGARSFGLVLGRGPHLRDVAATGNVIRASPIGIGVSVVEGAGAAVISDNLISGASAGAIRAMLWDEPISADLAIWGVGAYPHLTVERNRVS